jgi:putative transposase
MKTSYRVSERRACTALALARSTIRHESTADPQTALRMRLKDLAMSRIRYGYRRLHILIAREGWRVNHKRVYRLYREEGLAMRKRSPRRRKACLKRELRPLAAEKNECWSIDFMSDELFDGRRIRLLTIVDNHTRESLAIHVGQRIRGCEVVEVLEQVMEDHGRRRTIRVDNVLWSGVHLEGRRSLGLLEPRHFGLFPSWEADGQRLYRVLQRSV